MKTRSRVSHPVFGLGTVVSFIQKGAFDNRSYGENGTSKYDGALNLDVIFDNGGPRGFADSSSNKVSDLTEIV